MHLNVYSNHSLFLIHAGLFFQVKIWTHEEGAVLSFKVEMQVKVPSHVAFSLLSDFRLRQRWDRHFL